MTNINPNCWARAIGGCSEKISAEHIISRAILGLDGTFEVERNHGQPFRIGRSSFTAKMLCTTHNSELSTLDSEALRLYQALEAIYTHGKQEPVEARIDVAKIEAWFTKTFINAVVSGLSDIAGSSPRKQADVEQRLVDIVFGKRRFANGGGVYFVSRIEGPQNWGPNYHFAPILANGKSVCGMIFKFCALWFVLWASDIPLVESVKEIGYIKGYEVTPLMGETEILINNRIAGVLHYA